MRSMWQRGVAMAALAMAVPGALAGCAATPPNRIVTNADGSPVVGLPTNLNVLFWSQDERDLAFRMMEQIAPTDRVRAGTETMPLPTGAPLDIRFPADAGATSIEQYMTSQRLAGLIVLVDGQVRMERYGLGLSAEGRWTSFSVAKSFTSTLVGAALRDGRIGSLDDAVTQYIPALRGSGYDGVTVGQLLTMRSGVRWNEDYADPESDVARFNAQAPEGETDAVTAYMRRLPRAHEPGTQWNYNTGETNLIGVLVENATGVPLAQYLEQKLWRPAGMEADAFWMLNTSGRAISGCCLSMRLRDYARMGQFALNGGRAGDQQIVPEGWFDMAGRRQADIGRPGFGYGYQWWTYDEGSYAAQGIFGQGIYVDPARRLVIAGVGNWPAATNPAWSAQRLLFYRAVAAAVDAERAR